MRRESPGSLALAYSTLAFTSAEVSGSPLLNTRPLRSLSSSVLGSTTVKLSARPGMTFVPSGFWSRSVS